MSSTNISNSLIDAIQVITQSNLDKYNSPLTVSAIIKTIVNEEAGIYTVGYLNNEFEAYSSGNTYSVGEKVFLIIPDGNFSQKKFIIGSANPSNNKSKDIIINDKYINISGNLVDTEKIGSLELCSYENKTIPISLTTAEKQVLLNAYNTYTALGYNKILLKANFKTRLESHQGGNYGLTITFIQDNDEESRYSYSLDTAFIQGDPYGLNVAVNQSRVIQLPAVKLKGIEFNAFTEDFTEDSSITATDIWISDIEMYVTDVVTADNLKGYYMDITSDSGNFFMPGTSTYNKQLTANLYLDGSFVTATADYYWYIQDATVTTSSYAGVGWKLIAEGSNKKYLNISDTDVTTTNRYKCVIAYGGQRYSSEIEIKNLKSNYVISFSYDVPSAAATGEDVPVSVSTILTYDGSTAPSNVKFVMTQYNAEDKFLTTITGNTPVIDTANKTITCNATAYVTNNSINFIRSSVYLDNDLLGSLKSNISTMSTTDEDYRIVLVNGSPTFHFDVNGIPYAVNQSSESAIGSTTNLVEEVLPIGFKIYRKDGSELTESEYAYCSPIWTCGPPKYNIFKPTNSTPGGTTEDQICTTREFTYTLWSKITKTENLRDNYLNLTVSYGNVILHASTRFTGILAEDTTVTVAMNNNYELFGEVVGVKSIASNENFSGVAIGGRKTKGSSISTGKYGMYCTDGGLEILTFEPVATDGALKIGTDNPSEVKINANNVKYMAGSEASTYTNFGVTPSGSYNLVDANTVIAALIKKVNDLETRVKALEEK